MQPVVLASASPRRRELLERIGIAIEVCPADVDEAIGAGEAPLAYVARVADAKAAAIAAAHPGRWVLAADTIVEHGGVVLGKAADASEARAMVRTLAGAVHRVSTAIVLVGPGRPHRETVTTEVTMVAMTEAEIADYVASDEWRGKAGAYAVQGIAAALVSSVRGSITNVIGLPLAEVARALAERGMPPRLAAGRAA
jgi:septum formation protein